MYYIAALFVVFFFLKSLSFMKLHRTGPSKAIADTATFIGYIVIQQSFFFILWLVLREKIAPFSQIIVMGFLFGAFHVHAFFRFRKIEGFIFMLFGLIGGMVFSYLYQRYYLYGLAAAFVLHVVFHVLLDLAYTYVGGKPIKYYRK